MAILPARSNRLQRSDCIEIGDPSRECAADGTSTIAQREISPRALPDAPSSNRGCCPFSCWQYPTAIFPVISTRSKGGDCDQLSPAYCTICSGGSSSAECHSRVVRSEPVLRFDISALKPPRQERLNRFPSRPTSCLERIQSQILKISSHDVVQNENGPTGPAS